MPFPFPLHDSEVVQSRPTLNDPVDCSLSGSSVHGIFQARVLEWGAIAFSDFTVLEISSRFGNKHLGYMSKLGFPMKGEDIGWVQD